MNVRHPQSIYQIKVTLSDSKPPIWRRLLVPSTITLGELHTVLQYAMGWDGYHMHQFVAGDTLYGRANDAFDSDFGMETEDEDKYTLSQVLTDEKDWLKYEYDFGDDWRHKIVLEKILPHDDSAGLPRCIKGKRACPPEDCGGIWGYEGLLDIIQDPTHEEYQNTMEWLKEGFDPEHFDMQAINDALAHQCR